MIIQHVVRLAISSSVYPMNQPIAPPPTRMLEEGAVENPFPFPRENHIHGIIHPAGHHGLDPAALGPAPKDMRGTAREIFPARQFMHLVRERPFAPVDPSIRT